MSGETLITIVGNATADAELKFTQSGAAVASFTVASTPRLFKDGEWKDGEPLFLRCSIWRQPAENVAESVRKGTRLVVTGRLKQRSFDDKDGNKRTVIELEADEVALSTKFATVTANRTERATAGAKPAGGDVWGSAPKGEYTDEPPF